MLVSLVLCIATALKSVGYGLHRTGCLACKKFRGGTTSLDYRSHYKIYSFVVLADQKKFAFAVSDGTIRILDYFDSWENTEVDCGLFMQVEDLWKRRFAFVLLDGNAVLLDDKPKEGMVVFNRHRFWDYTTSGRVNYAGGFLQGYSDYVRQAVNVPRTVICTELDVPIKLAVLPNGNLVAGAANGIIKIWNLKTGKVESTLLCHQDLVALAVLTDGRIAVQLVDGTVKIWDLAQGIWNFATNIIGLARYYQPHTSHYRNQSVSFLPLIELPGGKLAAGSPNGTIALWDLATEKKELNLQGHSHRVNFLVMLSDGRLASEGGDGKIIVWDVKTGEKELIIMHNGHYIDSLVEHDGKLVIGARSDVLVGDLVTGALENIAYKKNYSRFVVTPHDKRIVMLSDDGDFDIFEIRELKK